MSRAPYDILNNKSVKYIKIMSVQQWVDVINGSLQKVWIQLLSFLPNLIGAAIVLMIGFVVAAGLDKLVENLVYHLKIDNVLKKLGVEAYLHRANLELNTGYFLGKVVYWFMVVAFVLAASDILGFLALSVFLGEVLLYIPQVIIAFLIVLSAAIVAGFLKKLVATSVVSARLNVGNFLGSLTWWVIMVFGLLAAVSQLGVATEIINTIVTGFIVMLALAGGLAFGLGGRDAAKDFIDSGYKEWKK